MRIFAGTELVSIVASGPPSCREMGSSSRWMLVTPFRIHRSAKRSCVGSMSSLRSRKTPTSSPASISARNCAQAADLILSWMREAGMSAHLDAIGNVCGRYEGERPGAPCLMLGSHYDTVRDAGKWDGPLGVITAISCVADLNRRGKRLPFAIEVVGFADEEGVRFASTLLGSRAVAGTFDESVLATRDRDGVSMRDALVQFGLDPDHIGAAARARRELLAYLELHIEQGPVLEAQNLPVGVVTAIAGATRLAARLTGMAGHAGTVPMALRRDALAGAAECIGAIEAVLPDRRAAGWSAPSVISRPSPARPTSFRARCRSPSTCGRRPTCTASARSPISSARSRPSPSAGNWRSSSTSPTRTARRLCAPGSRSRSRRRSARKVFAVFELPSGAGHDGMAMIDIADVGMIFVRCRGGISHHPDEHVELADADAGARVLLRVIENFRPRRAGRR